jgi:hypothetical protein
MNHLEQELRNKQLARLRVLQKINANDPYPITEQSLINAMLQTDSDLKITKSEQRKALSYLKDKGLVHLEKDTDNDVWAVRISGDGIDFLDGLRPDIIGLLNPKDL